MYFLHGLLQVTSSCQSISSAAAVVNCPLPCDVQHFYSRIYLFASVFPLSRMVSTCVEWRSYVILPVRDSRVTNTRSVCVFLLSHCQHDVTDACCGTPHRSLYVSEGLRYVSASIKPPHQNIRRNVTKENPCVTVISWVASADAAIAAASAAAYRSGANSSTPRHAPGRSRTIHHAVCLQRVCVRFDSLYHMLTRSAVVVEC